ncbi:hypothetical protein AGDE_15805 [Angomonas deanei]|uniref:Leucine rich repeat/Leucine Rich repeat/Leucine Rich Repeat, putative n=1 Tax=Angomonas deanei TaxID=59799 RepID=A0A7G2CD04_9TRYP|nr:hypothetical protein AGDE_15805 [Angomonas deanei]CAD2216891.1 Leucine rich repeat/Leucine Rich repeat/Leucine Rich Repeat, putative [Angomonas deanei]|eukprot:EPY18379.1 hypothetical protein AGDE_15805 [Angomonas deanei]
MELNLSNRGLFSFDGSVLTEETSLLATADTTAKSTQDIVKHRKSSNKQKKGNALIPKIAKINLSHNNLHLFTGGERLRTVTHLFLSHNELTSLYTSTLPPLLVVLDLSYNKLEEVSRLGATAAQLEVLDLSHNALTTDGIGQLPQAQLLQLNLSYNAIDSLEPIAGATRLTELNASFNVIGEGLFDKEDSYITYTSEEENETYASHYDKKKEQRGEKLMEHESVVGSLAALAQLPNLKKLDLRGNPLFSEPDDDRHHNHNNSSVNGDIIDTANQFILNNCKRLTMLNKVALSQSNQNQMYKARREHENSQTSRLLPHNTLQKNNNRSHIKPIPVLTITTHSCPTARCTASVAPRVPQPATLITALVIIIVRPSIAGPTRPRANGVPPTEIEVPIAAHFPTTTKKKTACPSLFSSSTPVWWSCDGCGGSSRKRTKPPTKTISPVRTDPTTVAAQ